MTMFHRCVQMRTRQVISILFLVLWVCAVMTVQAATTNEPPVSIFEMEPEVLLTEVDLSTNAVNVLTSLLAHVEGRISDIDQERQPLGSRYRQVKDDLKKMIREAEMNPTDEDKELQSKILQLEAELRELRRERAYRLENRDDIKNLQTQYNELMSAHERLKKSRKSWERLQDELQVLVQEKQNPAGNEKSHQTDRMRRPAGMVPRPVLDVK